jgi:hypothetical protein
MGGFAMAVADSLSDAAAESTHRTQLRRAVIASTVGTTTARQARSCEMKLRRGGPDQGIWRSGQEFQVDSLFAAKKLNEPTKYRLLGHLIARADRL